MREIFCGNSVRYGTVFARARAKRVRVSGQGAGKVSTHPPRGPHLLREEAAGNDELARAVDQALVVLEVARESHVSEDRLLEFAVQRVKHAVDAYARLLLLEAPSFRSMSGRSSATAPSSLGVVDWIWNSIPGFTILNAAMSTIFISAREGKFCVQTLCFIFSVFSSIEYKRDSC